MRSIQWTLSSLEKFSGLVATRQRISSESSPSLGSSLPTPMIDSGMATTESSDLPLILKFPPTTGSCRCPWRWLGTQRRLSAIKLVRNFLRLYQLW